MYAAQSLWSFETIKRKDRHVGEETCAEPEA